MQQPTTVYAACRTSEARRSVFVRGTLRQQKLEGRKGRNCASSGKEGVVVCNRESGWVSTFHVQGRKSLIRAQVAQGTSRSRHKSLRGTSRSGHKSLRHRKSATPFPDERYLPGNGVALVLVRIAGATMRVWECTRFGFWGCITREWLSRVEIGWRRRGKRNLKTGRCAGLRMSRRN